MAAIPVNPYFRSKSAEHDVTLTSLVTKLYTLDFKILRQCVKLLGERVLQVWWWNLHLFRRYRKKTRVGARNSPPPPVGRGLRNQFSGFLFLIITPLWPLLRIKWAVFISTRADSQRLFWFIQLTNACLSGYCAFYTRLITAPTARVK